MTSLTTILAFTTALDAITPAGSHASPLLQLLFSLGLIGVFLVSIVDSSFVPLPIPGITDIMVIVLAAQHANIFLLILASSLGSALGGYLSYQVGHSGGIAFILKSFDPAMFKVEKATKPLIVLAYSGGIEPKYAVPATVTVASAPDKKPKE